MPARDFTKQESILFYANVAVVAVALLVNSFVTKSSLSAIMSSVGRNIVTKFAFGIAFSGMFLLLLGAHYCRGWSVAYLVIQILVLLSILSSSGFSYFMSAFITALSDLSDPQYKEMYVNASQSILTVIQDNKSLQKLYPYLEENMGFCGLYDFTDVLGAGCAFSSEKACSAPKYTFLTLITSLLSSLFKTCGTSFIILLVVEIAFLVMIIIANRSSKNNKSSTRIPLVQPNAQVPSMYQAKPYGGVNASGSTSVQMTSV